MSELGKLVLKIRSKHKKQNTNVEMQESEQKPLARNGNLVQTKKLGLEGPEWIGNSENPIQKRRKH